MFLSTTPAGNVVPITASASCTSSVLTPPAPSRLSRAVKVLPVALKVSLPAPPVNAAPVSTPVVSEPVKVSQKSIVFNELRVVRGCLFGVTHRRPNFKKYALPGFAIGAVFAQVDGHSLTHCPPNPPMDGIVGGCGRGVFRRQSKPNCHQVWRGALVFLRRQSESEAAVKQGCDVQLVESPVSYPLPGE